MDETLMMIEAFKCETSQYELREFSSFNVDMFVTRETEGMIFRMPCLSLFLRTDSNGKVKGETEFEDEQSQISPRVQHESSLRYKHGKIFYKFVKFLIPNG